MRVWKVFDLKNGKPHFLFHALEGTRQVPLDKLLRAKRVDATDGSGTTVYKSGFHVFPKLQDVRDWTESLTYTDTRVLVRVNVLNAEPKKHSRSNIKLASHMVVTKEDWKRRKPLSRIAKKKEK